MKDETVKMLENGELDRIYQDICGIDYKGNVHMYIGKLKGLIKKEFRYKVYYMHLDKYLDLMLINLMLINISKNVIIYKRM